ncbi:MAG: DUF3015 domain-containing protein [Halobacteriovoraceae bacterium]|nr:DUF3015 domain-containing protein [Halobacteriovoraceae bacterium]
MKKLTLAAVMTFMVSSTFAAHGPAGCGLGSMLFAGKEGLVFNVLAATFNGSSGNQTFAMSTGTLGCEDAKEARVSGPVFIQNNREKLANDVARGQGETLDAYLKLIGAEKASKTVLKENFAKLFAAGNDAEAINHQILTLL